MIESTSKPKTQVTKPKGNPPPLMEREPKPATTPQQRPSVARIVHYWARWNREPKKMAAIIVHVHDHNPEMINIRWWNPDGAAFFASNVSPVEQAPPDTDQDDYNIGSWEWPARV